jgi:hypothetical protein
MVDVTCTTVVTQAQVDAGDSFTCDVMVTGDGATSTVFDTNSHDVPLDTGTRETTTKCAKMATPIDLNNLPPAQVTEGSTTATWDMGNGITVTGRFPDGYSSIFMDTTPERFACVVLGRSFGNSQGSNSPYSWSVSGLSALACDGCDPCLVLEVGASSVQGGGDQVQFSQPITPTKNTNLSSGDNRLFTNNNPRQFQFDGCVYFEQPEVTGDGQLPITGEAWGLPAEGSRQCVVGGKLYLPVIVTCYADNNEFISAVDCNGNAVAESDIDFS